MKNHWEIGDKSIQFYRIFDILEKYEIWSFNKMNQLQLMSCITEILKNEFNDDIDESVIRKYDAKITKDIKLYHISNEFQESCMSEDIIQIEILDLYVSIIYQEIKNGNLKFNYKWYGTLFMYLVDHLNQFKKHANQSAYLTATIIINSTYHFITSRYQRFVCCNSEYDFCKKTIDDMFELCGQSSLLWYKDTFYFSENQENELKHLQDKIDESPFIFRKTILTKEQFSDTFAFKSMLNLVK